MIGFVGGGTIAFAMASALIARGISLLTIKCPFSNRKLHRNYMLFIGGIIKKRSHQTK